MNYIFLLEYDFLAVILYVDHLTLNKFSVSKQKKKKESNQRKLVN